MDKKIERNKMITYLSQLDLERKRTTEKYLLKQLTSSSIWKNANVIGTTCSKSFEWNTTPIIEQAWQENKLVCVPTTCHTLKQMQFYYLYNFKELRTGLKKIKEPIPQDKNKCDKKEIDLLIVPGIVFDCYGFRIGFGGGYYDRFLVNFEGVTVSIASEKQMIDKVPVEDHDIPVQFIVTEAGCRKTRIIEDTSL